MRNYSISQRNKSRGSRIWYGRTFEDGVLVEERSLKTTNRAEAKAWLDAMNAARFLPENLFGMKSQKPVHIARAVNEYMDMNSGRVSDRYLEGIRVRLKNRFLAWCDDNGREDLLKLDKDDAEKFYLSMEGLKESSKRVVVTQVNVFIRWAIDRYDLDYRNPFESIKMKKKEKRFKSFWDDGQIDMILDAAEDPVERAYFALLSFTGLRHFESVQFGPSMIDRGQIHVIGKGDKEVWLPISDRLKDELSRVEIKEGMFVKYRDNDQANKFIKKAVVRTGMDASDATCHKFRHSFISNLASKNIEITHLQRLARHEDVAMTLRYYTHFHTEELEKSINARKEG